MLVKSSPKAPSFQEEEGEINSSVISHYAKADGYSCAKSESLESPPPFPKPLTHLQKKDHSCAGGTQLGAGRICQPSSAQHCGSPCSCSHPAFIGGILAPLGINWVEPGLSLTCLAFPSLICQQQIYLGFFCFPVLEWFRKNEIAFQRYYLCSCSLSVKIKRVWADLQLFKAKTK